MEAKAAMAAFYDQQVREIADQLPKKTRAQIEDAFLKNPAANPDDVDLWFERSFHKPPVSHDTQLFSRLHGMKAAIRLAFDAPAAEEEAGA